MNLFRKVLTRWDPFESDLFELDLIVVWLLPHFCFVFHCAPDLFVFNQSDLSSGDQLFVCRVCQPPILSSGHQQGVCLSRSPTHACATCEASHSVETCRQSRASADVGHLYLKFLKIFVVAHFVHWH